MKVSVSIEDGTIVVDGEAKFGFTFYGHDPNWRVIQWDTDHGWAEVYQGDRIWITDVNIIQPYVDMWQ